MKLSSWDGHSIVMRVILEAEASSGCSRKLDSTSEGNQRMNENRLKLIFVNEMTEGSRIVFQDFSLNVASAAVCREINCIRDLFVLSLLQPQQQQSSKMFRVMAFDVNEIKSIFPLFLADAGEGFLLCVSNLLSRVETRHKYVEEAPKEFYSY